MEEEDAKEASPSPPPHGVPALPPLPPPQSSPSSSSSSVRTKTTTHKDDDGDHLAVTDDLQDGEEEDEDDDEDEDGGEEEGEDMKETVEQWDEFHLYEKKLLIYRSSLRVHDLPLLPPRHLHLHQKDEDEDDEDDEEQKMKMMMKKKVEMKKTEKEGVEEGAVVVRLYQHQTSFRALNTVGLTVWKSSVALARVVEEEWRRKGAESWAGKRVIELGSGCGLTGIIATLLGAHTTLTDMGNILGWTRRNARENLDPARHTFEFKELYWGKTDLAEFQSGFDVVLAADLIYSPKVMLALLNTLHGVSRSDSRVLVAFENHNPMATRMFLAHLPRYFEFTETSRPDKVRMLELKRRDEVIPLEGDAWQAVIEDYSDDTESDYNSD